VIPGTSQFGICGPVVYRRCRDGDTVLVVGKNTDWPITVRLLDVWCPDGDRELNRAAVEYIQSIMTASYETVLFVPIEVRNNKPVLTSLVSFDRVLGYVHIGEYGTLNSMLIRKNLASSTKGGRLGE